MGRLHSNGKGTSSALSRCQGGEKLINTLRRHIGQRDSFQQNSSRLVENFARSGARTDVCQSYVLVLQHLLTDLDANWLRKELHV